VATLRGAEPRRQTEGPLRDNPLMERSGTGPRLIQLWIESECTLQGSGTLDDSQQQFLYARAMTTYFDLQCGLRSDLDLRPTRSWAAFGVQGLAPEMRHIEPDNRPEWRCSRDEIALSEYQQNCV
jgi:hypothetical protein